MWTNNNNVDIFFINSDELSIMFSLIQILLPYCMIDLSTNIIGNIFAKAFSVYYSFNPFEKDFSLGESEKELIMYKYFL